MKTQTLLEGLYPPSSDVPSYAKRGNRSSAIIVGLHGRTMIVASLYAPRKILFADSVARASVLRALSNPLHKPAPALLKLVN